jgi:hypothetical protein
MNLPETIGYRTAPPKMTVTATVWQAWWDDHDMWDGRLMYTDLDTAKRHAAVDYVGEEHGWLPEDDPDDEAPEVTLAWMVDRGRWHLLADGVQTGVQLYETRIWSPAVAAGDIV